MAQKSLTIAYIGQKGIPAQWGGVERATEELAVRMVRAGHTVIAYARAWYTKTRVQKYHGVEIVYTPSIHTKHFDTITHTLTALVHACASGVDVIHFQGIGPALLAWVPRLVTPRTHVLVTFHCHDRRLQKWNAIARAAFWCGEFVAMKCAHEIFVTSRFLQDYTYQVWGRSATYLPNGVFADGGGADDAELLRAFGLTPHAYVIHVGRFMPDKAQHEAIEAFTRFKETCDESQSALKLVLVGDAASNDPFKRALHEQAAGRTDIIFVGTQTGGVLQALMRGARVALSPSYSEGMPLAVLELASYGVPLILSDIPAHREIFGDVYPYVPVGDTARLAEHLRRVVTHTEMVRPVAHALAKRIKDHYRWEVIAARYAVSLTSVTSEEVLRPHALVA